MVESLTVAYRILKALETKEDRSPASLVERYSIFGGSFRNQSAKRFHNLRYIEKVANVPSDALAVVQKTGLSSGGSLSGKSTTIYNVADLYRLVKQYDPEIRSG